MMEDSPKQFGDYLKRERLSRGIGLEEVARATKVRRVKLEALEEGDFDKLPGAIFVKGYVQAYSHYIGLDENSILTRFAELTREPESAIPPYLHAAQPKRAKIWPYLLLVFLLVGGGIALWWFLPLVRDAGRAGEDPNRPMATLAPPPVDRNIDITGFLPETGEVEGAIPDDAPESGAEGSPAAVNADLSIAATKACWVEVRKGEEQVAYRLLEKGESLHFEGEHFLVTLGNREAVTVTWKGGRLVPPSGGGRVVDGWIIPPERGDAP